jgi:hypothetical protein
MHMIRKGQARWVSRKAYDDSSEPPLHYWASVRDIRLTRKLSSSATVRRRCQRCTSCHPTGFKAIG